MEITIITISLKLDHFEEKQNMNTICGLNWFIGSVIIAQTRRNQSGAVDR